MEGAQRVMAVDIVPGDTADVAMMRDLSELADDLQAADLSVETRTADVKGVKDGGLTVAIALASLTLSAISTLVTVLSYWTSRKPDYSVTLKSRGATFQLSGLDKNGVRDVVAKLKAGEDAGDIAVRVARR
jgi:hypothetical protein